MSSEFEQSFSRSICPRFGSIAVRMGFVTDDQVEQALSEQIDDHIAHRQHRLIGQILFEKGLMKFEQIDMVLIELSKELEKLETPWEEDPQHESMSV